MNSFTELCTEYYQYSDDEEVISEESKVENPHLNKENIPPVSANTNPASSSSGSLNSFSHDCNPEPIRPLEVSLQNFQDQSNEPEVVENRNSRPGILRDSLEKDSYCRAIVLKYDLDNCLTTTLRNRLSRFILKNETARFLNNLNSGELLSDFHISTSRFKFLANQIHETFPREAPSTYYTPFRRENNITVNASGKLWWHYDYSKNRMFKDGILASRGKKSNASVNDSAVSASCGDKLESLRTILSPWVDVIQLWVATFDARRINLINNQYSVKSYLDTFACLRTSKALSLFESDFTHLHPNAVSKLQNTWDFATDHLVEIINAVVIKNQNDLTLRALLNNSENSNQRTGILLSLLPYLIPPRRPGRKRKNEEIGNDGPLLPRTLSFAERKEAFFLHISSVVDLETVLTRGIDHTSRLALQHQPIPIIVGPFENVAACYIILENTLYQSDSILHAFESTIQICYAVNCEYPLNARSLWIFLQQAFLQINEVTDKPSNNVVALIGAITRIIEEVEINSKS